jgi:hypothetical protein
MNLAHFTAFRTEGGEDPSGGGNFPPKAWRPPSIVRALKPGGIQWGARGARVKADSKVSSDSSLGEWAVIRTT